MQSLQGIDENPLRFWPPRMTRMDAVSTIIEIPVHLFPRYLAGPALAGPACELQFHDIYGNQSTNPAVVDVFFAVLTTLSARTYHRRTPTPCAN
jgi:hypothetical protein